ILEMVGIPYVGSGPLAHSLALDKVVAKVLFKQAGLPTPDFVVLDGPDYDPPDLEYPLIAKPKNEAVSFGVTVVNNEAELRRATDVIFETFQQQALVEKFIAGREINVGILGNDPAEAFLPAEIIFGEGGPPIYTYADKKGESGRVNRVVCPAPLPEEVTARAQDIARRAFKSLGCYDCARVDIRIDGRGDLYLLEINSLPSIGPRGSYVIAGAAMGLDYNALMNRLVEVASARYFGTAAPPQVVPGSQDQGQAVFSYVIGHRDQIERELADWCGLSSRTDDPVGVDLAFKRLGAQMAELGLRPVADLVDDPAVTTWETEAGLAGGTLLIGQLDVPLGPSDPWQAFRRTPEWLFGEGVAQARAPWVMLEYACRALRRLRRLKGLPLGVLAYADEGRDGRYSAEIIRRAAQRAGRVVVLRPCVERDRIVNQRPGWRRYRLSVPAKGGSPGPGVNQSGSVAGLLDRLKDLVGLTSKKDGINVHLADLQVRMDPLSPPDRVAVRLAVSYRDVQAGRRIEERLRAIVAGADGWSLDPVSDRPPLGARPENKGLIKDILQIARQWEVEPAVESSPWPSVAGLVPPNRAVVCGLGPVAKNLSTFQEAVHRTGLVRRTLLLAQWLAADLGQEAGRDPGSA
ncbi:MAG: ATP-grasp domain-containing protein, partial [Proteobacteria bacterium]|nr:ATP-grasp domain-containing protein [Pseudomonadota bacterium]